MHNQKHAYLQKVEAELKEFEAKTELLKAKGNTLMADARVKFDEQLQSLEQSKSEFAAYYNQIAEKADDAWDDVKDEAEEKWTNFKRSVDNFISKHT
ncbi:MAG: hypothetical protein IPN42_01815 [Methylococcaceae bacterium]|nr:hypothetical protein [Methylococcaceae bacterium]